MGLLVRVHLNRIQPNNMANQHLYFGELQQAAGQKVKSAKATFLQVKFAFSKSRPTAGFRV